MFFKKRKDGGHESRVTGYWLVEIKWLFSIVLLRFSPGTRESYHDHAFHSVSWLLRGELREEFLYNAAGDLEPTYVAWHTPGLRPITTLRTHFHRVFSFGTSWVLTFRGPWASTWSEYHPRTGLRTVLTHGRREVTK